MDKIKPLRINEVQYDYLRCAASEFLSTFIFLFAVFATGINFTRSAANVVGIVLGGAITGFAAVCVLAAFGDISGAHFNPAVTFAALIGGKIGLIKGIMYIVMQLAASTAAAGCLYIVFPNFNNVGRGAVPSIGVGISRFEACAAEAVFTFIFILVVYMVALGADEASSILFTMNVPLHEERTLPPNMYDYDDEDTLQPSTIESVSNKANVRSSPYIMGKYYTFAAIGLTLGFLAMLGTNVSGGAFNPARVFGPELVSNFWGPVWIYWVGDLLGALIAVAVYFVCFSPLVLNAYD